MVQAKAKFLIHLVGERPALWDKTCENYRDRSLKEISWRQICNSMNKNYNSMSSKEKEQFTKTIMKKWVHIRDSWVKSMKYGYDPVTKLPPKPYIYHDELKFMQKILKCKPPRYDVNALQSSNMHFEEFHREMNETQNSNEVSQEVDDNSVELENAADGDFTVENFKQEPIASNNETEITIINKAEELNDTDDWNLEDTEIISVVEEEKLREAETTKRKRRSIFVGSRNGEECASESKVEAPAKLPFVSTEEYRRINNQRHDYNLYANRHWNFFMGILPSLHGLNEDHVLEFQSGVISLLQNLRKSQNKRSTDAPLNGRGRQHETSSYYEKQSVHNLNSRRKRKRHMSDPIAPVEGENWSDMESFSDN